MSGNTTVEIKRPDGTAETVTYKAADFRGRKHGCDLVMKGGITSGVVYPLAVAELAKAYRFHGIGGTSAGAVAAALTAAAEYARDRGGFERLVKIPETLGGGLLQKFQPERQLKPLFEMLRVALRRPSGGIAGMLRQAAIGYWPLTMVAAAAGLAIIVPSVLTGQYWGAAFGLVLAVLLLAVLLAVRLGWALTRELPAANFGLCSGLAAPGAAAPAFTDWLTDLLDEVAAREGAEADDRPLTFGDLESGRHPVELKMITSDIAMGRPYELPFRDRLHFFSRSEFQKLFPERVVSYMTPADKQLPPEHQNEAGDLFHFPDREHLPVVVATRMSLSFPGLIQAVPLHKRDFMLNTEAARARPRRCLFSDGGLTSNFPIHFFDRLWPNRPTFGINLDRFNPEADSDRQRVWMDLEANQGQILPIGPVTSLGSFVWALFNTAKGWQDNLQSVLPGYRERIVHIALREEEGGLNLEMSRDKIETLIGLGEEAGRYAVQFFDLPQHRWRRHLTAMARVEETMADMFESHSEPCGGPDSFSVFLAGHDPAGGSYKWKGRGLAELRQKTADLLSLAANWAQRMEVRDAEEMPHPESVMRITSRP